MADATHTLTRLEVTKPVRFVRELQPDEDERKEWCKVVVLEAQPYAMIVRKSELTPLPTSDEYGQKLTHHIYETVKLPGIQVDIDLMGGVLYVYRKGDDSTAVFATPNYGDTDPLFYQAVTSEGEVVGQGPLDVTWTGDMDADAELWKATVSPLIEQYLN